MCASFGPDYQVVAKLGEGSFAEVFKVKCRNKANEFLAIKRLKKRYRSIDEVNRLPEVLSLKALQGHPNIIRLVDLIYASNTGSVAMAFELMDCNTYEFISEHKRPFDEQVALILIYQLLKSISFMHSKNMFHRDIKPENCMINRNTLVLKLCDFGSTRGIITSNVTPYTEYVSTRWYRAPECILTSGSYGKEVDEWAVGCMLYELLTTRPLFPGKHEIDQITRIHKLLGSPSREILAQFSKNPNNQISFAFPQQRATDLHLILPRASEETVELLQRLLVYDPAGRIEACDALQLPVFAKIREFEKCWCKAANSGIANLPPFPLAYMMAEQKMYKLPLQVKNDAAEKVEEESRVNEQEQIQKPKVSFAGMGENQHKKHQPIHSPPPSSNSNSKQPIQSSEEDAESGGLDAGEELNSNLVKEQQKSEKSENAAMKKQQTSTTNNNHSKIIVQPPSYNHTAFVLQQNQQTVFKQQSNRNAPPILISKPSLNVYQQSNWKKPPPNKPLPSQSLIEARLQAARRIHEYNMKQKQYNVKKPAQQFHAGPSQFIQGKLQTGAFQKPRPDLIQPRLPKIIL